MINGIIYKIDVESDPILLGLREHARVLIEKMHNLYQSYRKRLENGKITGYKDETAKFYYDVAVLHYEHYGLNNINLKTVARYLNKSIDTLSKDEVTHEKVVLRFNTNILKDAIKLRDQIKTKSLFLRKEIAACKRAFAEENAKIKKDQDNNRIAYHLIKIIHYYLELGSIKNSEHYLSILKDVWGSDEAKELNELLLKLNHIKLTSRISHLFFRLALPQADDMQNLAIRKPETEAEYNSILKTWEKAQDKIMLFIANPKNELEWELYVKQEEVAGKYERERLILQRFHLNKEARFYKFLLQCLGKKPTQAQTGEVLELLKEQNTVKPILQFKSRREKFIEDARELSTLMKPFQLSSLYYYYKSTAKYYEKLKADFIESFYYKLDISAESLKTTKRKPKGKNNRLNIGKTAVKSLGQIPGHEKINAPLRKSDFLTCVLPYLDSIADLKRSIEPVHLLDWNFSGCKTEQDRDLFLKKWQADYTIIKNNSKFERKYLMLYVENEAKWYFYGEHMDGTDIQGYLAGDSTEILAQLWSFMVDLSQDMTAALSERTRKILKAREPEIFGFLQNKFNQNGEAKDTLEFASITHEDYLALFKKNAGLIIYDMEQEEHCKLLKNRMQSEPLAFAAVLRVHRANYITICVAAKENNREYKEADIQTTRNIYIARSYEPVGKEKSRLRNILKGLNTVTDDCLYKTVAIDCQKQRENSKDSLIHAYLNAAALTLAIKQQQLPFLLRYLNVQPIASKKNVEKLKYWFVNPNLNIAKQQTDNEEDIQVLQDFVIHTLTLAKFLLEKIEDDKQLKVEKDKYTKAIEDIKSFPHLIELINQWSSDKSVSEQFQGTLRNFIEKLKTHVKSLNDKTRLEFININKWSAILKNSFNDACNSIIKTRKSINDVMLRFEDDFRGFLINVLTAGPKDEVKGWVNTYFDFFKKLKSEAQDDTNVLDFYQKCLQFLIDRAGPIQLLVNHKNISKSIHAVKSLLSKPSISLKKSAKNSLDRLQILLEEFSTLETGFYGLYELSRNLLVHCFEHREMKDCHDLMRENIHQKIGRYENSFDSIEAGLSGLIMASIEEVRDVKDINAILNETREKEKLNKFFDFLRKQIRDDKEKHSLSSHLRKYMMTRAEVHIKSMYNFRHRALTLMESLEKNLHAFLLSSIKTNIRKGGHLNVVASDTLSKIIEPYDLQRGKGSYKDILEILLKKRTDIASVMMNDLIKSLEDTTHSHKVYFEKKYKDITNILKNFARFEQNLLQIPFAENLEKALFKRYDNLSEEEIFSEKKGVKVDILIKLKQQIGFADIRNIISILNSSTLDNFLKACEAINASGDEKGSAEISDCVRHAIMDVTNDYINSLFAFRIHSKKYLNQFERELFELFSSYKLLTDDYAKKFFAEILEKLIKLPPVEGNYKDIIEQYLEIIKTLDNKYSDVTKVVQSDQESKKIKEENAVPQTEKMKPRDYLSKFILSVVQGILEKKRHTLRFVMKARYNNLRNLLDNFTNRIREINVFKIENHEVYQITVNSILLTETIQKLKEKYPGCTTAGNEIRIISSNIIHLDDDPNWPGVSIAVISPYLNLINRNQWSLNTSGDNAVEHGGPAFSPNGNSARNGLKGADGIDGRHGKNAGHVYIVTNEYFPISESAKGGTAAKGQNGGNGSDGLPGPSGKDGNLEALANKYGEEWRGTWASHSYRAIQLGGRGEDGGRGGDNGYGGMGGEGGDGGDVDIAYLDNLSLSRKYNGDKNKAKSAGDGVPGTPGNAGAPGRDGKDTAVFAKSQFNLKGVCGFLTGWITGAKREIHLKKQGVIDRFNDKRKNDLTEWSEHLNKKVLHNDDGDELNFVKEDEDSNYKVYMAMVANYKSKNRGNENKTKSTQREQFVLFDRLDKKNCYQQTVQFLSRFMLNNQNSTTFQHWMAAGLNDFLTKYANLENVSPFKVDNLPDFEKELEQIMEIKEQFSEAMEAINDQLADTKIDTEELSIGNTLLADSLAEQHANFRVEHQEAAQELNAEIQQQEQVNENEQVNANNRVIMQNQLEQNQSTQLLVEMAQDIKVKKDNQYSNIKIKTTHEPELIGWVDFPNNQTFFKYANKDPDKLIKEGNEFISKFQEIIEKNQSAYKFYSGTELISISINEMHEILMKYYHNLKFLKLQSRDIENIRNKIIELESHLTKIVQPRADYKRLLLDIQKEKKRYHLLRQLSSTHSILDPLKELNSASVDNIKQQCYELERRCFDANQLVLENLELEFNNSSNIFKSLPQNLDFLNHESLNQAIRNFNATLSSKDFIELLNILASSGIFNVQDQEQNDNKSLDKICSILIKEDNKRKLQEFWNCLNNNKAILSIVDEKVIKECDSKLVNKLARYPFLSLFTMIFGKDYDKFYIFESFQLSLKDWIIIHALDPRSATLTISILKLIINHLNVDKISIINDCSDDVIGFFNRIIENHQSLENKIEIIQITKRLVQAIVKDIDPVKLKADLKLKIVHLAILYNCKEFEIDRKKLDAETLKKASEITAVDGYSATVKEAIEEIKEINDSFEKIQIQTEESLQKVNLEIEDNSISSIENKIKTSSVGHDIIPNLYQPIMLLSDLKILEDIANLTENELKDVLVTLEKFIHYIGPTGKINAIHATVKKFLKDKEDSGRPEWQKIVQDSKLVLKDFESLIPILIGNVTKSIDKTKAQLTELYKSKLFGQCQKFFIDDKTASQRLASVAVNLLMPVFTRNNNSYIDLEFNDIANELDYNGTDKHCLLHQFAVCLLWKKIEGMAKGATQELLQKEPPNHLIQWINNLIKINHYNIDNLESFFQLKLSPIIELLNLASFDTSGASKLFKEILETKEINQELLVQHKMGFLFNCLLAHPSIKSIKSLVIEVAKIENKQKEQYFDILYRFILLKNSSQSAQIQGLYQQLNHFDHKMNTEAAIMLTALISDLHQTELNINTRKEAKPQSYKELTSKLNKTGVLISQIITNKQYYYLVTPELLNYAHWLLNSYIQEDPRELLNQNVIETNYALQIAKLYEAFSKANDEKMVEFSQELDFEYRYLLSLQSLRKLFASNKEARWIELAFAAKVINISVLKKIIESLRIHHRDPNAKVSDDPSKNIGRIKQIILFSLSEKQNEMMNEINEGFVNRKSRDTKGYDEKELYQQFAHIKGFILPKQQDFLPDSNTANADLPDTLSFSTILKFNQFLKIICNKIELDGMLLVSPEDFMKSLQIVANFEDLRASARTIASTQQSEWLKSLVVECAAEKYALLYSAHNMDKIRMELQEVNSDLLILFLNLLHTQYTMQISKAIYSDLDQVQVPNYQILSKEKWAHILSHLKKIKAITKEVKSQLAETALSLWDITLYEIYFSEIFNRDLKEVMADRQKLEKTMLYLNSIRTRLGIDNVNQFMKFYNSIVGRILQNKQLALLPNENILDDVNFLLNAVYDLSYPFDSACELVKSVHHTWKKSIEGYRQKVAIDRKIKNKEVRSLDEIINIMLDQSGNGALLLSRETIERVANLTRTVQQGAELYKNLAKSELLKKKIEIEQAIAEMKNSKAYQDDNEGYIRDPGRLANTLINIVLAWFVTKGEFPHPTQIISFILFVDGKDNGFLEQLKTGEGKTLIVGLTSGFMGLCGYSVDVVSSNRDLAESGVEKCKPFFDLLQLSCAHNCTNEEDKRRQAYKSTIVYGEVGNFQGDILETDFKNSNVFNERYVKNGQERKKCLIVDEVDSMCLDKARHVLYHSHEIECLKWLEFVLPYIWLSVLREKVERVDEFDNKVEEIKKFINARIDANEIFVPNYLKDEVKRKMKVWVESAFQAKGMTADNQFVFDVPKNDGTKSRTKNIIVVDKDTGVEQYSTRWSNGLAQFLELKYRRKLTVESLQAVFISNTTFFSRYGKSLFGLTGTLGSENSKSFLADLYHVRLAELPTARLKDYTQMPGKVAGDSANWLDLVCSSVVTISKQRPVLVICETIEKVDAIIQELKTNRGISREIIRYARDGENIEKKFNKDNPAKAGDIIIATNKGGRGTDIAVDVEYDKQLNIAVDDASDKGLHVILSYLPDNERISDQAFGRTSRNGNPGTGQYILELDLKPYEEAYHLKEIPTERELREKLLKLADVIIEQEIINRDKREAQRLSELKRKGMLHDEIKKNLLTLYKKFKDDLTATIFKPRFCIGNKENESYDHQIILAIEAALNDKWAFWLSNIKMEIDKIENIHEGNILCEKFRSEFAGEITARLNKHLNNEKDSLKGLLLGLLDMPEDAIRLAKVYLGSFDKKEDPRDVLNQPTENVKFEWARMCLDHAAKRGDLTGFAHVGLAFCRIVSKIGDARDIRKDSRRHLKKALYLMENRKRLWMSNSKVLDMFSKFATPEQQKTLSAQENYTLEQTTGKLEVLGLQLHYLNKAVGENRDSYDFVETSKPSENDKKKSEEIYNHLVKAGILQKDGLRKHYKKNENSDELRQLLKNHLDPSISDGLFDLLSSKRHEEINKKLLETIVCHGEELWNLLTENQKECSEVWIIDETRIKHELESQYDSQWKKLRTLIKDFNNVDIGIFNNPESSAIKAFLESKKILSKTPRIPIHKVTLEKLKANEKYKKVVFNASESEPATLGLADYLKRQLEAIKMQTAENAEAYLHQKDLPYGDKAFEASKIFGFLKEKNILKSGGLARDKYGKFKDDLDDILESCLKGTSYEKNKKLIKSKLAILQGDVRYFDNIKASLKGFMQLADQTDIPSELPFFDGAWLNRFMIIEEDKSWWDWGAFAVFLIGIVQVVAGAVLCFFGLANLGNALISEGINDMTYAVMSMITGTFSWKEWGTQKAISFALSIVTAGIQTLANIGKTAAKIGSISLGKFILNTVIQAVTQVGLNIAVNLISNGVLDNVRSEVITKVLAGIFDKLVREATEAIKSELYKINQKTGLTEIIKQFEKIKNNLTLLLSKSQNLGVELEAVQSQVLSVLEGGFKGVIDGLKNSSSPYAKAAGTAISVAKTVKEVWDGISTALKAVDTAKAFIEVIQSCMEIVKTFENVQNSGKVDNSFIDEKVNELAELVKKFIKDNVLTEIDKLLRQIFDGTVGKLYRSTVKSVTNQINAQFKSNNPAENKYMQEINANIVSSANNAMRPKEERLEMAKAKLMQTSVVGFNELTRGITLGDKLKDVQKLGDDLKKTADKVQTFYKDTVASLPIQQITTSYNSLRQSINTLTTQFNNISKDAKNALTIVSQDINKEQDRLLSIAKGVTDWKEYGELTSFWSKSQEYLKVLTKAQAFDEAFGFIVTMQNNANNALDSLLNLKTINQELLHFKHIMVGRLGRLQGICSFKDELDNGDIALELMQLTRKIKGVLEEKQTQFELIQNFSLSKQIEEAVQARENILGKLNHYAKAAKVMAGMKVAVIQDKLNKYANKYQDPMLVLEKFNNDQKARVNISQQQLTKIIKDKTQHVLQLHNAYNEFQKSINETINETIRKKMKTNFKTNLKNIEDQISAEKNDIKKFVDQNIKNANDHYSQFEKFIKQGEDGLLAIKNKLSSNKMYILYTRAFRINQMLNELQKQFADVALNFKPLDQILKGSAEIGSIGNIKDKLKFVDERIRHLHLRLSMMQNNLGDSLKSSEKFKVLIANQASHFQLLSAKLEQAHKAVIERIEPQILSASQDHLNKFKADLAMLMPESILKAPVLIQQEVKVIEEQITQIKEKMDIDRINHSFNSIRSMSESVNNVISKNLQNGNLLDKLNSSIKEINQYCKLNFGKAFHENIQNLKQVAAESLKYYEEHYLELKRLYADFAFNLQNEYRLISDANHLESYLSIDSGEVSAKISQDIKKSQDGLVTEFNQLNSYFQEVTTTITSWKSSLADNANVSIARFQDSLAQANKTANELINLINEPLNKSLIEKQEIELAFRNLSQSLSNISLKYPVWDDLKALEILEQDLLKTCLNSQTFALQARNDIEQQIKNAFMKLRQAKSAFIKDCDLPLFQHLENSNIIQKIKELKNTCDAMVGQESLELEGLMKECNNTCSNLHAYIDAACDELTDPTQYLEPKELNNFKDALFSLEKTLKADYLQYTSFMGFTAAREQYGDHLDRLNELTDQLTKFVRRSESLKLEVGIEAVKERTEAALASMSIDSQFNSAKIAMDTHLNELINNLNIDVTKNLPGIDFAKFDIKEDKDNALLAIKDNIIRRFADLEKDFSKDNIAKLDGHINQMKGLYSEIVNKMEKRFKEGMNIVQKHVDQAEKFANELSQGLTKENIDKLGLGISKRLPRLEEAQTKISELVPF